MKTKVCKKCNLEKPISCFAKDRKMTGGYSNLCSACNAERSRLRRQEPHEKEREKDTRKEWYYQRGGKEIVNRNWKAYKAEHGYQSDPYKEHARSLVQGAIRRGKIIRKPCAVCGNPKSEAHHEDYSKPFDVVFLCGEHHRERERDIRADAARRETP